MVQPKVLGQFFCCFPRGQVIEAGREVNHIAGSPAAKAVEVILIYFHAGGMVIVKRTTGHTVSVDLNSVKFCCLPDQDGLPDGCKDVFSHVHSPAVL